MRTEDLATQFAPLAEFRYRIRLFLAFSEATARAHGIEPGQHQMLLAIAGMPAGVAATIGAVAERLAVRHNSAVELAARAEKGGLVKRRPAADDRRAVTLAITAKGRRVLSALSEAHREELATHAPVLVQALRAIVRHPAKRAR